MTGIIEELEQIKNDRPNQCSYVDRIQILDDKDQQDLELALKSDYETTAILRVLKARNILISYSVLSRHRRGECICGNI